MQESLWAQQKAIGRAGALYLAGYVLVATAIYAGVDIYAPEEDGLFLVSTVLGWVIGYLLLAALMRVSASAEERMPGGIGGYFGLSLVTGIAVFIGTIFLILPGVYLMMRWLPAFARAYAKPAGIGDAMKWSWEHTAPIQMPVLIVMIPALACYGLLLILIVAEVDGVGFDSPIAYDVLTVGINLAISIAFAWLQLLGVAAYRLIEREPEDLVETFS